MVKGRKSSWVTRVKDRLQQAVWLVFKKTHQNNRITNKQKTHKVQEGKVKSQQRAALLPKWDLDAKMQEWACCLFRGTE